jgi:hypothetical protein
VTFCLVFYIFRPIWIKFGTEDVHNNLLSSYELCEVGAVKVMLYLGGRGA